MRKKGNYFLSTSRRPYHLSVGVVLVNNKGEVCCQRLSSADGKRNLYLLVRETARQNESLETAAVRGLKKEFGMKGRLERYLGLIASSFPREGRNVEKTTLYFLYRFTGKTKKSPTKLEKHFEWIKKGAIEWYKPAALIRRMKAQRSRLQRSDLDESSILMRIA